jgi:hypothetical protein
MPDQEGNTEPESKGRITRRDLIRRGAIVGGTLVWAAPAMQTFAKPAYALVHTPGVTSCCVCAALNTCITDLQTCADCQAACAGPLGGVVKYRKGELCFCSGFPPDCAHAPGGECEPEVGCP